MLYLVLVDGTPVANVRSQEPEVEIRKWVAAGYRHPSITADNVVLERIDENVHVARWERLEMD